MCGIVAYLGYLSNINIIHNALNLLKNRGYDSVGISTIINNILLTIKYASTNTNDSLDTLINNTLDLSSNIFIAHTRWSTHGPKTDLNSHPHSDNLDRISLVHNGIIENYLELKKELINKNYSFKSETDTEIISVLIGYYLDQNLSIHKAIQTTINRLQGTYALVIMHKDYSNKMWCVRCGSPLLLGISESFIMLASEQIAFGNNINKYIVLNNHDLIEITCNNNIISYNKDIQSYSIKNKIEQDIQLTPFPHNHWMQKEIYEQSDAINRALNNGGRISSNTTVKLGGLDSTKSILLDLNHLILLGCGTSFHAGLWSLDLFKSLDIFDTVSIYDGSEFNYKDIAKKGKTGLLLLSQSGETKDLHRCLSIAKNYDLITIGVVNVIDSMIARETDCGVYLNAGREVAVASTKSFTSQCIILSLIAIWFAQERGTCLEKRRKIIVDLRNVSWQVDKVLNNWSKVTELCNKIDLTKSCFILGKGSNEAIAKEAALKLKEIAYIHAEGFSSSALKHGPFALIVPNLPIFILDTNQEHTDKNSNACHEVKARFADVYMIGFNDEHDLLIDYNKTFGGLLGNVYLQILSYEIALKQGYNPDYPRNLAKVVTVE